MAENVEEVIKRAEAIGRVLAEPLFVEVVEETRQAIIREWEGSLNVNQRETAHATLKGLAKLMEKLKAVVSSGEHVRAEMTRPRRPA